MFVAFPGRAPSTVRSATIELFHLYSRRPGWVLDARLDGATEHLLVSGTCEPGPFDVPRALTPEYCDAPVVFRLDERPGTLLIGTAIQNSLTVHDVGDGCARIQGSLPMRWRSLDGELREFPIEIELIAAIVT